LFAYRECSKVPAPEKSLAKAWPMVAIAWKSDLEHPRSQPTSSVISPLDIFINAKKTHLYSDQMVGVSKTSAKYENHISTCVYIYTLWLFNNIAMV
jgi:hypothetical protein